MDEVVKRRFVQDCKYKVVTRLLIANQVITTLKQVLQQ